MIRTLLRHENGDIETSITPEELRRALLEPTDLLWLDIGQEPLPQVEALLTDSFNFHALAIEDALIETHLPKVDEWHDYLYIVLRSATLRENDELEVQTPELDIFLGSNFLVTYAAEPVAAIDRVWNICQQDERWLRRGPDYLLYRLADEIATQMVAVVDNLHDQLDEIEDEIFGDTPPDTLEELFTLKRNILRLRRVVLPQRDVLQKLSRDRYTAIDAADRIFFRDVHDHLMQLYNLLDDMLILVGGALDTYLSVVNNRLNDVMKTLTIITAFFMPLAFITGFFGMNFFAPVAPFGAWTGRLAFLVSLIVMFGIPAAMFWWMRRQAWI